MFVSKAILKVWSWPTHEVDARHVPNVWCPWRRLLPDESCLRSDDMDTVKSSTEAETQPPYSQADTRPMSLLELSASELPGLCLERSAMTSKYDTTGRH
eukprot:168925-Amphidinium_carterae.3